MSQITFRVDFSLSFRAGKSCPLPPVVTIEVDPATLSQEDRDLIAERLTRLGEVASRDEEGCYVSRGGRCRVRSTAVTDHGENFALIVANGPTIDDMLAAVRAEDEAIATYADRQAAKQAAYIAERRKLRLDCATGPAQRQEVRLIVWLMSDGATRVESYRPQNAICGETATYQREYIVYHDAEYLTPEEDAAYRARHDRLAAESQARRQAAIDQARATLLARNWQPRLDWIASHGSARLKRLAAEGIEHEGTYTREREACEAAEFARLLEAERPGWTAIDEGLIDESLADVPERALALLDAGRAVAPECHLAKLRATDRYVVVEQFRGRLIYWPRD